MERLGLLFRRIFPALLFVAAFVPRAVRPVSRPLVWYLRSAHFVEAVLGGDWADTVYSEHPGVGLMWPVGLALKLYWTLSGATPAACAVPPDFEPIHFFGPVPQIEIAVGVASLALLIALGIVGVYLMLRRLFDGATAAVAGSLLAVSPYYLAQSKVLHLDAWMATLMLLSGLALLLYRRERRVRWLLLSGVLGGLALLVKTPALFLLPFSVLVLLADVICGKRFAARTWLTRLFLPVCGWLLVALGIYVSLWPVLWVDPGRGLAAVAGGLARHAATAHDTPTFFRGEVLWEDPGPAFYGAVLLFRTAEVELTFPVVAAVLGMLYLPHRRRLSHAGVDCLFLLAYAFFFLLQMCLAAKKMPRYVLPALLALDVLASVGIVAWARGLAGGRRALAAGLMVLPLLVQAALILPRHPYYGTAFNRLGGGPQAAARTILTGEEGEGLAELAAVLNSRPDAEQLTVAAQLKHVFSQTFRGDTVDIDRRADYLAFHRNYTVRGYKVEQWGDLWERYGARTPEQEVVFDGVPYAWLYSSLPVDAAPEHGLAVRLGDRIHLLGYDLRAVQVAPGDGVPLVLYWQAEEPVTDDLSVFVHLLDPAGELAWQDDGAPAHGARPTWGWAAGETVADPHTILLPTDLCEGGYALAVGLYDWRTGERLPAVGVDGARLADDRVEVAVLAVRRPRAHPATWVAWGVAGLVVLSALFAVGRGDA